MVQKNQNKLFGQPNTLFNQYHISPWAFLVAQLVKNLPAMQEIQEMQVQSLGQEDPLEEGMATHTSILPGESPWTEDPGGLQSIGSQRVRHNRSDLACTHQLLNVD